MKSFKNAVIGVEAKRVCMALFLAVTLVPGAAMAKLNGAAGSVTGFFDNINNLLNIASISVVTIAVIFAGYQIAFAHKRIGDVAPVLIGGFLIGAAGQLAKMLLPEDGGAGAMLLNALPMFYA